MEDLSGEKFWHVFGSDSSLDEEYNTHYCDGAANCSDELQESLLAQLVSAHSTVNPIGDQKNVPMDWNTKKYSQIKLYYLQKIKNGF